MWRTVHVVSTASRARKRQLQSRNGCARPGTGQGVPAATYVYATQIAEVDVDDETGEVEVLRIVASHDCGTPINPMLVEGQVEGGISMGVGFALQEEMLFDSRGRLINPNLTNYIMPTSLDMPKVEVDIVDSFDPTGPFGAKGVGEPTCVATAAAIMNAIHDAVGVRITSLPATAEKSTRRSRRSAPRKPASSQRKFTRVGRASGPLQSQVTSHKFPDFVPCALCCALVVPPLTRR